MVAGEGAVTEAAVTVKVALVDPAGTVTLDGTVAREVLLLDSVTTAPPDGAALLSVTVPCDVLPENTVVGFNPSEESWPKGLTVS